MNKLIVLLLVFMTTCCARQTVYEVSIPPELTPYYDRFINEGYRHRKHIDTADLYLVFVPRFESDKTYGECIQNGMHVAEISRLIWERLSDLGREQLVFHELGHCLLHRKHTSGTFLPFVPLSIMNPEHFSDDIYAAYREYYLAELFGVK